MLSIRCRASYAVDGTGSSLTQRLTCASDSYRFVVVSEVIANGSSISGSWSETTRSTWKRGAWDCAVEASYELTADASTFHLVETLRATSEGQEIFSRTHTTDIPRDLI